MVTLTHVYCTYDEPLWRNGAAVINVQPISINLLVVLLATGMNNDGMELHKKQVSHVCHGNNLVLQQN